jgi:hypothetical protein
VKKARTAPDREKKKRVSGSFAPGAKKKTQATKIPQRQRKKLNKLNKK